ncbi:MAG: hypothetical protein F4X56_00625 [Gammaproteobacteria bacterium]|nr:hypothetical protein [Gammaproteobacteria bacterium]MYC24403.1 hypothetical protein [Gammaproteobacteria bacterium]
MFKSNQTKTISALIGGAIVGSAATLAVVFLLPFFKGDSATDWRAGIPSNIIESKSGTTGSSDAPKELEDILQFETDFERKTALFGLLMNASESSVIEYLEESQELEPPSLRRTTENVIVQKLASLNAQIALDQVHALPMSRQQNLITAVFEELSLSDLNKAKNLALELDPTLKHAAVHGILLARHKHSDDLMLEIAKDLNQEAYAVTYLAEAVAFSAFEDAALAWSRIVSDSQPNLAQTEFLIQVASEWLLQEGISVIDQISESLTDTVVRDAVIMSALHRIAQDDPRAALIEALQLTSDSRELALRTIAEVWARIDPQAALAEISTMESGKTLTLLQESVLTAWAENDPNALLEALAFVPEHLRAMAKEEAMLAIARISPEEAVSFLSDIEDDNLRIKLAKEIATNWSEQDPHAALDWVLNEEFTTDVQQAETLMIVLASLAIKDPELAFQTARDQPIVLRGANYRGMEVTVIQHLVETDIDKALAMLSDIRREGLTITHAYSEVGRAMIRDGQYDRALALGQRLGDIRRRNYNGSLMYQWAMTNPETLFEALDELPSDQLKDQAAKGLVRYNNDTKALSSAQMEQVGKFLPEGYVDPYSRTREMRQMSSEWFDEQVQLIFINPVQQEERKEE